MLEDRERHEQVDAGKGVDRREPVKCPKLDAGAGVCERLAGYPQVACRDVHSVDRVEHAREGSLVKATTDGHRGSRERCTRPRRHRRRCVDSRRRWRGLLRGRRLALAIRRHGDTLRDSTFHGEMP